ncbi:glycoside hydrolase family 127 protein [Mucilaginibacter rubeus]|uniref:Glycoside hydrolase family 127 protein n=1 Tax=Mucilaginibacter rubeus TaxID=2027860 RepID=A0AAE6JK03_9SPHI|nr:MULTISPECIES: glycoside hydrolase family 127 protein [Mucilaginibacter]QEM07169.1 glycoside hydrolase family 127 protein [Mucilaginibacter rubeus]QEM19625.1 glycoside hydrolase family 127 protein [Mucilaginibacter gossypii]QTE43683.1 glycoside hydrolase family 127 protein [Mucilaginibacter rubeus]QTE50283.1 glycoside hydrolase family 127 protein [Mucilaginibacter rubeus]QTE55370.1 glycoside hydrolase family 127 protein [Mucilaginibacter rubeus]
MEKIRVFLLVCALCVSFDASAQYVGQHRSAIKTDVKIPVKAYSFDLQDVQLLNSRFKDNMDREGSWMLSLPVERLLHSFRVNAGMLTDKKSSKTKMPVPLGGWEALDMELRGHSIGHLMSGLSFQYAATRNMAFKKKIDSLVSGLAEVQATLDEDGYLSAFPQNYIDRNIEGKSVWAPWYTLHKITAGLIDAYWYAGNAQALDVVTKMASWAYHKIIPLNEVQLALMLRNEFGGMNEAWYNLYAITGNPDHKKLGDLFYHHAVLDPLAAGQDKLNRMHANTVIPKITGEARAYELTGNATDKAIVSNFWDNVIHNQTYVIGSNSDKEHFIEPGKISKYITGYTGETCNTYNLLKVTRHLFTWDADVRYADYYERALYNHILGQQDPKTGMVCYFTPLKAGAFRLYSTRDSSFWCCVGSGFESQSKYGEAIYYHNDQGVYVNLFIPSVLTWKAKGLKLRQETAYPEEATTRLTVDSAGKESLALYIRYPSWASNGARVKINGKNIKIDQVPGSYISLNRKWKAGDKVEITYPMILHLEPTPDNPKIVAVMYGPVVLAGEMGTEAMPAHAPYHDPADPYQYYDYDYNIPANLVHSLHINNQNISDAIKPVKGEPLTFKTINTTNGTTVTLEPYYNLHRQRYVVYWNLN